MNAVPTSARKTSTHKLHSVLLLRTVLFTGCLMVHAFLGKPAFAQSSQSQKKIYSVTLDICRHQTAIGASRSAVQRFIDSYYAYSLNANSAYSAGNSADRVEIQTSRYVWQSYSDAFHFEFDPSKHFHKLLKNPAYLQAVADCFQGRPNKPRLIANFHLALLSHLVAGKLYFGTSFASISIFFQGILQAVRTVSVFAYRTISAALIVGTVGGTAILVADNLLKQNFFRSSFPRTIKKHENGEDASEEFLDEFTAAFEQMLDKQGISSDNIAALLKRTISILEKKLKNSQNAKTKKELRTKIELLQQALARLEAAKE